MAGDVKSIQYIDIFNKNKLIYIYRYFSPDISLLSLFLRLNQQT